MPNKRVIPAQSLTKEEAAVFAALPRRQSTRTAKRHEYTPGGAHVRHSALAGVRLVIVELTREPVASGRVPAGPWEPRREYNRSQHAPAWQETGVPQHACVLDAVPFAQRARERGAAGTGEVLVPNGGVSMHQM